MSTALAPSIILPFRFNQRDLEYIKFSAAENLKEIKSPPLRMEIVARSMGFRTYASMQAGLDEHRTLNAVFETAEAFASERGIKISRLNVYLTLAGAAALKVANETAELNPDGYGTLSNAGPPRSWNEERAKIMSGNHASGFLRALSFVTPIDKSKGRSRSAPDSYGLKHRAEKRSYLLDGGVYLPVDYVNNWELIAAAIYAGFKPFQSGFGKGNPNVDFNMAKVSIPMVLAGA